MLKTKQILITVLAVVAVLKNSKTSTISTTVRLKFQVTALGFRNKFRYKNLKLCQDKR